MPIPILRIKYTDLIMKTRLLYFASDWKVGLTTAHFEQICELNKENDIELYCISSENEMESGYIRRCRDAGINITVVNGLDEHADFGRLCHEIEKTIERYDITHVNVQNNWQLALVSWLKYRRVIPRKFKIIYTIHGYRHNSSWKSVIAIAVIGLALLLFTDRVISMSSYVSRRFWFVGYKTDVVFYMMTKPEFAKTNNEIEGSPLKMMFPAQFRNGKRQEILIDALRRYVEITGDREARLCLPGKGPLLEEMKQLSERYGLNDNVIFPGEIPHGDVIKMYETCNIALVSSNVETYGRCIAEPFALGRCVVTQRTGIALDIIEDGVNGAFFTDADSLCKLLVEFYGNPTIVTDMANKAFADKVVFSRDNVMQRYKTALGKA